MVQQAIKVGKIRAGERWERLKPGNPGAGTGSRAFILFCVLVQAKPFRLRDFRFDSSQTKLGIVVLHGNVRKPRNGLQCALFDRSGLVLTRNTTMKV